VFHPIFFPKNNSTKRPQTIFPSLAKESALMQSRDGKITSSNTSVISPMVIGGNIMFFAQIIIFLCVILSNTLLEMSYNSLHMPHK